MAYLEVESESLYGNCTHPEMLIMTIYAFSTYDMVYIE